MTWRYAVNLLCPVLFFIVIIGLVPAAGPIHGQRTQSAQQLPVLAVICHYQLCWATKSCTMKRCIHFIDVTSRLFVTSPH